MDHEQDGGGLLPDRAGGAPGDPAMVRDVLAEARPDGVAGGTEGETDLAGETERRGRRFRETGSGPDRPISEGRTGAARGRSGNGRPFGRSAGAERIVSGAGRDAR